MEKVFSLPLDQYLLDLIDRPVRSHEDCTKILLNAIKYWQISDQLDIGFEVGKLSVNVSKMSRLFIEKENCIYSIHMPFTIKKRTDSEIPAFHSQAVGEISNQLVSEVFSIFDTQSTKTACISNLADEVLSKSGCIEGFWPFFWSLLSFESGYLRYDFDMKNENGLKHPPHHLDIFFSSNSTFKIGLNNQLNVASFTDVLEPNTNCHFLLPK